MEKIGVINCYPSTINIRNIKRDLLLFDKIYYNLMDPMATTILHMLHATKLHAQMMKGIQELDELRKKDLITPMNIGYDIENFKSDVENAIYSASKTSNDFLSLDISEFKQSQPLEHVDLLGNTICETYTQRYATIFQEKEKNNEFIPLFRYKNFEDEPFHFDQHKTRVIKTVLNFFPTVDEDVSLSKLMEIKSDKELKSSYDDLINFIKSLSKKEELDKDINEEVANHLDQYKRTLSRHQKKHKTKTLIIVLGTIASLTIPSIRELSIAGITSLFMNEVDYYSEVETLPGKEVAYISKIDQQLNKK